MSRLGGWPGYGPPKWDVTSKHPVHGWEARRKRQKDHEILYFSDWLGFQNDVLVRNADVKRELRMAAEKALAKLRAKIPLGDAKNGHMRYELKVKKLGRTSFGRSGPLDRYGYGIVYTGRNPGGFAARLVQSSYPSKEAYRAAVKEAMQDGGKVRPVGDTWVWQVAREMGGKD